jgi:hypothetical protein
LKYFDTIMHYWRRSGERRLVCNAFIFAYGRRSYFTDQCIYFCFKNILYSGDFLCKLVKISTAFVPITFITTFIANNAKLIVLINNWSTTDHRGKITGTGQIRETFWFCIKTKHNQNIFILCFFFYLLI